MSTITELINAGAAEECPVCGGLSVYEAHDAAEGVLVMPEHDKEGYTCGHCERRIHEQREGAVYATR